MVLCLCGSTKFKDHFIEANRVETLQGHIVVGPGVFGHSGDPLTEEDKIALDRLHLKKIKLSDEVLVLNIGGYIGDSTRREIQYAVAIGRRVRYQEKIK